MRALAITALLALCAGCPCEPGYSGFESDFEYCDQAADCEWSVAGDGTAIMVPTIHPGETGVELSGQVSLTATTRVVGGNYNSDGQWIELVTNCHGAFNLEAIALGSEWELALTLPSGHTEGMSADYRVRHLNLPPIPVEESTYIIGRLTIKNQSGRCVIDQVRIMTPSEC